MDYKEIKKILDAFDKSKTNVLELETDKFRIYLDKTITNQISNISNQPVRPAQTANIENASAVQKVEAKAECKVEGDIITSPMVGTFYQAPSPDSPAYVKVGNKVKKGQILCVIEAMKIMNELEAEYDLEILEILVEDGEPVEFDTPLFRVKRLE